MIGMRPRNAQGFKRSSVSPGSNAALRVRGIEGWRGVAALLVVVVHVWTNMGTDDSGLGPGYYTSELVGWFFGNIDIVVDLFFVLSGVLLWLPFARAALDDTAPVPNARNFLYRRVLRFIPLYWFIVVLMWSSRNYGIGTAQWLDLVEHILLIHTFDSERIFYTIGPAWTLSVEWMFYLSLTFFGPPFVRWVRERPTTGARVVRMLGTFAVVASLSVLYKANVAWVWNIPVESWAWRFGPAAKADTFLIGMAVATLVVLLNGRQVRGRYLPLLLIAGLACYWPVRVPPGADANMHFEVIRHTASAGMFALILLGVMTTRWDWVSKVVDNRLALRLSIIAYALYLLHEPVLLTLAQLGLYLYEPTVGAFLLNLVWVLALAIPVAWLGHRLVEEPWTDLGALQDRNGHRKEIYPDIVHYVPINRLGTSAPGALRQRILAGAAEAESPDDTEPKQDVA